MLRLFCITAAILSRPAPVSTYFAESGTSLSLPRRLNCMNTRFHSSMYLAQPLLTRHLCPGTFFISHISGPRSICISLQGPQGPVSPISQKLSFLPQARTFSASIGVTLVHKFAASSSSGSLSAWSPAKTVAHNRSDSIPQTSVRSSQAHWIASALK